MDKYDVIILGGGPAGYRAALELDKQRKKVLLIEKAKLGGTCLHKGCIPTKSLLCSAKRYSYCREFVKEYDIRKANEKKEHDIQTLYQGLKNQFRNSDVVVLNAQGRIKNKQQNVFIVEAEQQEYQADHLIVATGSVQRSLSNIPGMSEAVRQGHAVYTEQFFSRKELGRHIVIIGGGVIGIELASYLGEIGKKITIIECEANILQHMVDQDVRSRLQQSLAQKNINCITGCNIVEIDETCVIYEKEGKTDEIAGDLILVAGGREANTKESGIEEVGVRIKDGCVTVDEHCETNITGIYACGDVIGKNMLAHEAYKEAEIVVSNICGNTATMQYQAIPKIIYCNPEVAAAGYSEEECIRNGIEYSIKKCSMNYSSRYLIEYENQPGICKMIFNSNHCLIGAQLIGNGCSELIFVLAEMISQKLTQEQIKEKVYPHPSIVEIIKEVVNH